MWSITEFDSFLILASDGLWELMESEEAVQIVGNLGKTECPSA